MARAAKPNTTSKEKLRPAKAKRKSPATAKASSKGSTRTKGNHAASTARKAPAEIISTGYWLLKSEPDAFSWDQQKARGEQGEPWSGVRNYLARNNMRAMRLGDLGFFYHSNIGKEIVGVVRVIALAHPDPTDTTGTWECVDVEAICDLPRPVTLEAVKENPKLASMALVTSMRLSVQPVTAFEWAEVCRMGGLDPQRLAPAAAKRGSAARSNV